MSNILTAKIQVTAPGVAEAFKIVSIGVTSTERGLTNLQKALIQTGGGVKTFTNNFTPLVPALKNLPVAIENTNRALIKLPNASNQATQSMINLGRVVQDAPFGFLGIANNLNPLLESFQRLRATTGTTGGALKALGSSLLGAGGLGFALSVVSSALIVFGDKLFGAGEASKASENELARLAERLKEVKDNVKSLADEIQFLNQLGAINVKIIGFGDIEDLRQQFVAQQELYIKLIDARSALVDAQIELTNNEILNDKDLAQAKKENRDAIAEIDKQINDNANLSRLLKQKIRLQNINDEKDADKELERLRKERLRAAQEEYEFQSGLLDLLLSNFKRFQSDRNALFKITESQKLRFNIFADLSIAGGSAFTNFSEEFKPVSDTLQKEVERLTKNNPILLEANAIVRVRTNIEKAAQAAADIINNAIANLATEGISSVAETLGEALAGGDLQKGFKAFGNVIASGVQTIGKELIRLGVIALLAKKALQSLFANPALTIAAGIALVAAGAALRQALSGGINARALGGPVRQGQPYLVGERGPELFVPDSGGRIVSNNNLRPAGGIQSGGMAVQVVGQLLLRGNDLVAALANANRSQSRLT